jgi:hypothetical protein
MMAPRLRSFAVGVVVSIRQSSPAERNSFSPSLQLKLGNLAVFLTGHVRGVVVHPRQE